jgi:hypothetical protein
MNKGDKIICIKDYNDSGWLSKNYSVTKGQLYEVSGKRPGINYNQIDTSTAKQSAYGTTITLEGKGSVNYPIELFKTLQQWRDNQLNQILI